MAIAILSHTPGGTKEQYEQVLRETGMSGSTLAPGNLVRFAGPSEDGWLVVTVWESQEAFDKQWNEKILAARQKAGLGAPKNTVVQVHALAK
jgi:heme-degrading monooxygenase HmoA